MVSSSARNEHPAAWVKCSGFRYKDLFSCYWDYLSNVGRIFLTVRCIAFRRLHGRLRCWLETWWETVDVGERGTSVRSLSYLYALTFKEQSFWLFCLHVMQSSEENSGVLSEEASLGLRHLFGSASSRLELCSVKSFSIVFGESSYGLQRHIPNAIAAVHVHLIQQWLYGLVCRSRNPNLLSRT